MIRFEDAPAPKKEPSAKAKGAPTRPAEAAKPASLAEAGDRPDRAVDEPTGTPNVDGGLDLGDSPSKSRATRKAPRRPKKG